MTVEEIVPEITKVLHDRLPTVYWAPDGVRRAIGARTGRTVLRADFEEALSIEVQAGNVGRGPDRIWLPEAVK